MLIHFGVTPYMVFDGDYLPSKAATEMQRSRKREDSRKLGLELHQMGKYSQAHIELLKAVDVTPEMARQLIDELRRHDVQYVVAPYEADAQLVYLERKGIIQGILSEDSDLLVFGAKLLLTKLDQYGDCIAINRNDFATCRDVSFVGWSDNEFRRMAILSGCDYLPSINKMGLKTAYRLVRKYRTIENILRMLQFDGHHFVPPNYLEDFRKAELTFLHQRVFCPDQKKLVMISDIGIHIVVDNLSFIGEYVQPTTALRVAVGDLHPTTKQPIIAENRKCGTTNPRWSALRRQNIRTPLDPKFRHSIVSYYKPKRVPLAKIDPNMLTPPRSQVLNPPHSSGSTISFPLLGHMSSSSSLKSRPKDVRDAENSDDHAAKRLRLCKDLDERVDHGSLTCANDVWSHRSHFFTSSVQEPSPSIVRGSNLRRPQNNAISICSDDSTEDAMAKLPDTTLNTSQTDGHQIPDGSKFQMNSDTDGELSSINSSLSMQAFRLASTANGTLQSTSLAPPDRSSDAPYNTNEFHKVVPSSDDKSMYQACKTPRKIGPSRVDIRLRCPLIEEISNVRDTRSQRNRDSSLLRVVQSNPIAKAHVCEVIVPRSLVSPALKKNELLIAHPDNTNSYNSTRKLKLPTKNKRSSCRGSEDLIFPDTDEEIDKTKSTSEAAHCNEYQFEVSRFVFKV